MVKGSPSAKAIDHFEVDRSVRPVVDDHSGPMPAGMFFLRELDHSILLILVEAQMAAGQGWSGLRLT
ncbi:MAG TPA: hypothetical protein VFW19_02975 [Allosphingosinicella sp.]|nr:hypothetical protein [Allosphingosinicella sp.]